jgi:hypothetical protein
MFAERGWKRGNKVKREKKIEQKSNLKKEEGS